MRSLHYLWLLVFLLVGCRAQAQPATIPALDLLPSPQAKEEVNPSLTSWTAVRADQLIQELLLEDQHLASSDPVYHQALLSAVQDALWLFPAAQQSTGWQWTQIEILAQDGASSAAQTVGRLIASALQSEEVSKDNLIDWLEEKEPAGTYTQASVPTSAVNQDLTLLEFKLTGQPAYFVIARLQGEYQVSLIASGREFQSNPGVQTYLEWHDLTGDGQAEAWIITVDQNRRIEQAMLVLYDLSSGSAQRVLFSPELPMIPTGNWQILEKDGKPNGLQVSLRLDDGSALCEYLLPVEYHPEGAVYQRTFITSPRREELLESGFSEAQANLCLDLSVDWLRANTNRDDRVSLNQLEELMPGFPYGSNATLYVGLYPPDEIDRARFELGLNYALRQDLAGVERWMSAVIDQPAYDGSPWQVQAQAFMDAAQAGGGLRSACLASRACLGTGRLDLDQMVELMQDEDWSDPAAFLEQMGADVVESGMQDFNLDGKPETWWLENTGSVMDTFRILARSQDQPWLSRLNLPADTGTLELESLTPLFDQPVYRLRHGASDLVFLYSQADPNQAPAVLTLEQYRARIIQSVYTSLLRDGQAAVIYPSLADLQASPYFNCGQPSERCQPSAQLAYLSALSLDLAGDLTSAVAIYQRVAEDFPDSSYAILANARLEP